MWQFIKNVFYFTQGSLRYKLFYTKFAYLIPIHIREQIEYRISVMDKECYNDGQCKLCGCTTTALQMADKTCGKPCYPKMMGAPTWTVFKTGQLTINGFKYAMGKNKN